MGWLEHHREHVAEVRAHEQAVHDEAVLHTWEDEEQALESLIDLATNLEGSLDGPVDLKRGEVRFFTLNGAGLVEVRRGPGHRMGGYAGPSFRIAKGVYWHMGATAATYVPGADVLTVIDEGTAIITNQRVIFAGVKLTREFAFAKLIGYEHDPGTDSTSIHVSNRQKVSSIRYGAATQWCFYFDLAHAHFTGDVPGFIANLKRQLVDHEAARPVTH